MSTCCGAEADRVYDPESAITRTFQSTCFQLPYCAAHAEDSVTLSEKRHPFDLILLPSQEDNGLVLLCVSGLRHVDLHVVLVK